MRLYLFITIFSLAALSLFGQSSGENFIKSTEYLTDDGDEKIITVQYFDGLGRPKQIVNVKASPEPGSTGAPKNLVTKFEYDGFGRQVKDFLPVPIRNKSDELLVSDADYTLYKQQQYQNQVWYSEKTIENSPLNRVMAQAAPGNHWAKDSGHEIEFEYKTNGLNEVRRFRVSLSGNNDPTLIPEGHYGVNQLYKTTTIDENGHPIHEFKDKQGRVVLKRTTVTTFTSAGRSTDPEIVGVVQSVDTYYVYDIYGNLTYVIPPLASAKTNPNDVLDELCYQYKYDERNRLVEKQLPGKGVEYMVYDKQDRLVATQDANLRADGKWLFTKYDKFGRVVYTGIYAGGTNRSTVQTAANNAGSNNEKRETTLKFTKNGLGVYYTSTAFPSSFNELLSVNYYDTYNDLEFNELGQFEMQPVKDGEEETNNLKGYPVATFVRALGTSAWEKSFTVYDTKTRMVGVYKSNYLEGFTKTESLLDFRGKPLETETIHKRTPTGVEIKTNDFFTYDNMERPVSHYQSINNSARNLIADSEYNRLGQLQTKYVGGLLGKVIDRWQKIDYSYNIRGWLTGINTVSDIIAGDGTIPPSVYDDLFAFQIRYQNPIAGADPLYNGNISQAFWKTASDNIQRGYSYTYDQLNRLRRADFYKQGNANITGYGEYISYDLNGNITHLVRNTGDAYENEIAMDDLGYAYENGTGNSNQLRNVKDFVTLGMSQGFNDGNTAPGVDDYEYDENGNMTIDRNKGIVNITYNHLNLPQTITFNYFDKIEYLYNAIGQKVMKKVTIYHMNHIEEKVVDYLDGFQYAGGILQFFPTAEGYVKTTPLGFGGNITSYAYNYVFNYTDHLGNVRVSYTKDPQSQQLKILEENHYYPFGLKHSAYGTGSKRDYVAREDVNSGESLPPVVDYVLETDYQYKYQGQERQDELGLNWDSFKWRNYDYAIGRFMSIDPLAEQYSYQGTYNFSENRVVDAFELEGLEAVRFNVRSFAPYNSFGPTGAPGNYKGDGANRGFTTSSTATSRVSMYADFNASNGSVAFNGSDKSGSYTTNLNSGESKYSGATLSNTFKTNAAVDGGTVDGQYKFDLAGSNSLIPGAPDIDLGGKLNMTSVDLGKDGSMLQVSGNINGDRFPASETFMTDASGNSVFLGASGALGSPMGSLPGKGSIDMSSFNFTIQFDGKGNMTNVLSGGKSYTVGEWNQQFQQQNPQDDKVATRINN